QLIVGEEQVIKSLAPVGMLAAVFEDDGRTGYFYALDESLEGNPILDAVHISQLIVGEEQVIKSLAPVGMLAAVFEDDGRTGYF
ncbi:DUF2251 domain-containing protein, partial [Escherichia coli]|uniref:DUF2251 domain-containing protein n=1 Tax=Escherichia coli TaxID=562 RepID=UPI0032DFBB18